MATTKLKWRFSYATPAYDTPDEDLDMNQYAEHEDGEHYIIRTQPKHRANTIKVEKAGFDLAGRKKVNVKPGRYICFSQFELPNGKMLRVRAPDDLQDNLRTIPSYPQPKKELTDEELQRWQ